MHREPWIHFCGPRDPAAKRAVLDSLTSTGVATRLFDINGPPSEGIVCFSSIDEDLYEFVREVSHNRQKRVLAVPLASAQLDSAQAWRLLLAGASDVFRWSSAAEMAERVKARFERWRAVDELLQSPAVQKNLIGSSPAWRSVLRQIVEVARFTRGRPADRRKRHRQGTGRAADPRARSARIATTSSSLSTARRSCRSCPAASSSATSAARSPARSARATARSRRRTAARCFSTRSASCRCPCRPSCCASCRRAPTSGSAATRGSAAEFRLVCATNSDLLAEHRARPIPPRPVLPDRRLGLSRAAAAGAARGHPAAGAAFPATFQPDIADAGFRPAGAGISAEPRLSGQRARPAAADRAHRQPARRPGADHGRRSCPPTSVPRDAPDAEQLARSRTSSARSAQALSLGVGLKEISQAAADTAIRIAVQRGERQPAARRARLGVTDRALQMRRAARRQHNGGSDDQAAK